MWSHPNPNVLRFCYFSTSGVLLHPKNYITSKTTLSRNYLNFIALDMSAEPYMLPNCIPSRLSIVSHSTINHPQTPLNPTYPQKCKFSGPLPKTPNFLGAQNHPLGDPELPWKFGDNRPSCSRVFSEQTQTDSCKQNRQIRLERTTGK